MRVAKIAVQGPITTKGFWDTEEIDEKPNTSNMNIQKALKARDIGKVAQPFTVGDCEKNIQGHHVVNISTKHLVHEHDSLYTQTIEKMEEVVLQRGQEDVIEKFAEEELVKGAINFGRGDEEPMKM